MPPSQAPLNVILAYGACALIWGTTWFGIRVCIGPGGYPIYTGAAIRFTIATLVISAIWLAKFRMVKRPTAKELGWLFVAGSLSGIDYALIYAAEGSLSGGIAAVLLATQPLMTGLLGAVTKTERLSLTASTGSIIAVLGVCLVFHDRLQVSVAQAYAVWFLMIVCVLNAFSNIIMKKYANAVDALASNAMYFGASSVFLWATAMWSGDVWPKQWNFIPTLALLYLTIFGTLIAFGSFFYMLKHVRLSTAMTLSFVTPVIAVIVDAFFERAVTMSNETYAGILIVLAGVAISIQLREKKGELSSSNES